MVQGREKNGSLSGNRAQGLSTGLCKVLSLTLHTRRKTQRWRQRRRRAPSTSLLLYNCTTLQEIEKSPEYWRFICFCIVLIYIFWRYMAFSRKYNLPQILFLLEIGIWLQIKLFPVTWSRKGIYVTVKASYRMMQKALTRARFKTNKARSWKSSTWEGHLLLPPWLPYVILNWPCILAFSLDSKIWATGEQEPGTPFPLFGCHGRW